MEEQQAKLEAEQYNSDIQEQIDYEKEFKKAEIIAGKIATDENFKYLLTPQELDFIKTNIYPLYDEDFQYDDYVNNRAESGEEFVYEPLKKNPLTAEDYLNISNRWQEEMNNPTEMSKNMTYDRISEKVSNYYSLGNYRQNIENKKITPREEFIAKQNLKDITALDISKFITQAQKHSPEKIEYLKELLSETADVDLSKKKNIIAVRDIINSNKEYKYNFKQNVEHLKNIIKMETPQNQKEFDKVEYLKKQMKYLGFGEDKELHEALDKGIQSDDKKFTINTSSDKTLPGNKMDYVLNFNKSDKGVFLNSFDGKLTNRKGEELTHNFPVNKNMLVTAKEALNLLEGRSVKVEYKPKNAENSTDLATAFIKLNLKDEKTDKGQYKMDFYTENYGVNTADIVSKAGFVFDKPEHKDYLIKNLEKGNVAKAKFEINGKVIQGKAILNPQYKNIQFYDSYMNRINTNKAIQGLENDNKQNKANVKQHSQTRSL